jgi:polar amino acid transport system substrate-binding protein
MARLALVALYFFALMITPTASAKVLELVTLQYPPYAYQAQGEVKGMAVELIQEAFRRMKQPIKISILPWARAIYRIEQGQSDAIFTIYKTKERAVFTDYSNEILIHQSMALFTRKDSPIKFDGQLSALAQYRFGVVRKVSYGDIFDQAVSNHQISPPDITDTGEQNVMKLLQGRFDILVSNKLGALHILQQMGQAEKVSMLSPEIEQIPSYIAFSKKNNLQVTRDQFDATLREMKRDGSYAKIVSRYLLP